MFTRGWKYFSHVVLIFCLFNQRRWTQRGFEIYVIVMKTSCSTNGWCEHSSALLCFHNDRLLSFKLSEIDKKFPHDSPNRSVPSWFRWCSGGPSEFVMMVSSNWRTFLFLGRPFCWVVVGKYGSCWREMFDASLLIKENCKQANR